MIEAEFTCKCPGCGHLIIEGDGVGLVDGDWCCVRCVVGDEANRLPSLFALARLRRETGRPFPWEQKRGEDG